MQCWLKGSPRARGSCSQQEPPAGGRLRWEHPHVDGNRDGRLYLLPQGRDLRLADGVLGLDAGHLLKRCPQQPDGQLVGRRRVGEPAAEPAGQQRQRARDPEPGGRQRSRRAGLG